MALTNLFDLEARWRTLDADEAKRAVVLMGDAEALMASYGADLITLDGTLRALVVTAMVKRAMATPSDQAAVISEQMTAGPYSTMLSFANPQGDLYLTANEKRILGVSRQRIASLHPDMGGGND